MNYLTIRTKDDMIMLGKFDCGYSFPLWLRKPTFDCDWYWGLGYLAGKGVHTHYDTVFDSYKIIIDKMVESPYNYNERFKIHELMSQLYTLREYASMMKTASCGYCTAHEGLEIAPEQNEQEYKRICNVLIPTVWNALVNVMVYDDEKHNRDEERRKLYLKIKEYV